MADAAIERVSLDDPELQRLIAALDAETLSRYPEEEGPHFFRLDPHEVAPGRGAIVLARIYGEAVGCGAMRVIGPRLGELKRMYTVPEARGKGVGRAILDALEEHARELGVTRLVLETGVRQPEAIALYERAGFAATPKFGEYADSEFSVCLGKDL